MFGKSITATYEDALEFICNNTLINLDSITETGTANDAFAKMILESYGMKAMEELAAFVYGKTADDVLKDVERLLIKKKYLASLKDDGRGNR